MIDTIDPVSPQEILFDGISDIKITESVVRFAVYAKRGNESVIVARLAVPISELPEVIQELVVVLTSAAKTIVKPVTGH